MKNTTLLFLVKKERNVITNICLAMKKRGFGVNRWNGYGGKLDENESVLDAVIRETQEEIMVIPTNFYKVAEIAFSFPNKSDWNQFCHVYFCTEWDGQPAETEEMKPKWFSVSEIPFKEMWPDDVFWLPKVLEGFLIQANFSFGENDAILAQEIKVVELFNK